MQFFEQRIKELMKNAEVLYFYQPLMNGARKKKESAKWKSVAAYGVIREGTRGVGSLATEEKGKKTGRKEKNGGRKKEKGEKNPLKAPS